MTPEEIEVALARARAQKLFKREQMLLAYKEAKPILDEFKAAAEVRKRAAAEEVAN